MPWLREPKCIGLLSIAISWGLLKELMLQTIQQVFNYFLIVWSGSCVLIMTAYCFSSYKISPWYKTGWPSSVSWFEWCIAFIVLFFSFLAGGKYENMKYARDLGKSVLFLCQTIINRIYYFYYFHIENDVTMCLVVW